MAGRRLALGAICALLGLGAEALGLPAAFLVAGLAVGVAAALGPLRAPTAPAGLLTAGEALIGVTVGAVLRPEAIAGLADVWSAAGAVILGTLVLSVIAGLGLASRSRLDRPTAVLGLIPGGAPGAIAVSRAGEADSRVVSFMQFGRVFAIVATVPFIALALPGGGAAGSPALVGPASPSATGLGVCLTAAALGVPLARRLRIPAGVLIGPLVLGALAAAAGLPATPPAALQQAAFAAVGLGVGLSFDRDAVRLIGGALRPILVAIVAVLVGCAALGLLLAVPLGVDPLSAYLATTPGGLSAVLATAQSTGADLSLVFGLQSIRLVITVAAAPLAARLVAR